MKLAQLHPQDRALTYRALTAGLERSMVQELRAKEGRAPEATPDAWEAEKKLAGAAASAEPDNAFPLQAEACFLAAQHQREAAAALVLPAARLPRWDDHQNEWDAEEIQMTRRVLPVLAAQSSVFDQREPWGSMAFAVATPAWVTPAMAELDQQGRHQAAWALGKAWFHLAELAPQERDHWAGEVIFDTELALPAETKPYLQGRNEDRKEVARLATQEAERQGDADWAARIQAVEARREQAAADTEAACDRLGRYSGLGYYGLYRPWIPVAALALLAGGLALLAARWRRTGTATGYAGMIVLLVYAWALAYGLCFRAWLNNLY
jgi:hypothetical protein